MQAELADFRTAQRSAELLASVRSSGTSHSADSALEANRVAVQKMVERIDGFEQMLRGGESPLHSAARRDLDAALAASPMAAASASSGAAAEPPSVSPMETPLRSLTTSAELSCMKWWMVATRP